MTEVVDIRKMLQQMREPVRQVARRTPHRIPTPLRVWEGPVAEQRVQRRLAEILAANVVCYSRLMEQDETGTLARLDFSRLELQIVTIRIGLL